MKLRAKILAAALFAVIGINANAIDIAVDVVTVVDESGSMSGEHAWIDDAITALEAELVSRSTNVGDSLTSNYGLVGFGSAAPAPRQIDVGGSQLGTAAQFATATGNLVLSGGFEDGYAGMQFVYDTYSLTPASALNIILVSDEDRDTLAAYSGTTYASLLSEFTSQNALLNAVVNCTFTDGSGAQALGIDSKGNAYIADGNGGFTTSAGGTQSGSCFGTTNADYVNLALATGGAAWDLNLLRAGGLTAASFTAAFVDIKVGEIVRQQPPGSVPTPGSLSLFGLGILLLAYSRRKLNV